MSRAVPSGGRRRHEVLVALVSVALAAAALTGCGAASGPPAGPGRAATTTPAAAATPVSTASVVQRLRTVLATSRAAARSGVLAETTESAADLVGSVARFDAATGRFATESGNGRRTVSTDSASYLYDPDAGPVRRLLGRGDDVWEVAPLESELTASAIGQVDELFAGAVLPERPPESVALSAATVQPGPDGTIAWTLVWGDPSVPGGGAETATWTVDRAGRLVAWESSSPSGTTSVRFRYAPQHVDLPSDTVPESRYLLATTTAELPGRLAEVAEDQLCHRPYEDEEDVRPRTTVTQLRRSAREWAAWWAAQPGLPPTRVRDIPGGVEIGGKNVFTGGWVVEQVVVVDGKARLRWKPSEPWGGPQDQAHRLPRA